jgi:hypothetical protein
MFKDHEGAKKMKLLIVVIHNPDLVADIVSTLVDLDVRGIVSLESESIMQFLAQEVPIFAGLRELMTSPRSFNKILLGICDNDEILKDLYAGLKEINIDLKKAGMGYAFTIPIDSIIESSEE